MKCRDAHEMLNSYIDNGVDPMNDKLLAEHIGSCQRCRDELEFLLKYKNILKSVKHVNAPDNFMSELHRRIELETAKNPLKKMIRTAGTFISSYSFPFEAAGVLAVALLVFFLYRPFFSEKIPEKTGEYGIESRHAVTDAPKNKAEIKRETGRIPGLKTPLSEKNPARNEETVTSAKTPGAVSEDRDLSSNKENSYDILKMDEMKKSRSAAGEKRLMKEEEKPSSGIYMDDKKSMPVKKDSVQGTVSDIENLFREFNVTVTKSDLSDTNRLFYRIRVHAVKHTFLMKRIHDDYSVEEKIVKKSKTYYEIELYFRVNKK